DRTEVRDPGLLPLLAHGVVAEDAVADQSVGLLVELVDRAALRDRVDVRARLRWSARTVGFEGVPIADPKIQPVIVRDRRAARRGWCGSRCGCDGLAQGARQQHGKKSSRHIDSSKRVGSRRAAFRRALRYAPAASWRSDASDSSLSTLAVF